MILLFTKFLIAHIIGDFVLQPDSWVKNKKAKKHKSKYLYFHGLVHFMALLVLFQFNWSFLPYFLIIVISHLVIDIVKINLEEKVNTRWLFFIDQILHVLIISAIVYFKAPYKLDFEKLYSKEVLLLLLALLIITSVSSIIMKMLMGTWSLEEDNSEDSLESAGKYIGILERLFVFSFILLNQWSAIGLLIAAKSVFRFGDLSRAKDRKLTEYMLIGTLISFGMAIFIGLLYKYAITLV
ncbi:DUF3307 domain-containing protein [Winogradskyella endarachnes]|uniref:DUF3307 domain-containing protein n=1 Tax=Winogradskyella endarachnes TaxID=2681965 RepID=A0A6L6U5Q7_9FLAO|nr:DUF3307 domain-containing protein [Winogradskyella endarachnes]MUU77219.1 DUF3307 domain-containing protein [Winogradskyella endarachnes]